MWRVAYSPDPLCDDEEEGDSVIARASASISDLLRRDNDDDDGPMLEAFEEGGRSARVALADLAARTISDLTPWSTVSNGSVPASMNGSSAASNEATAPSSHCFVVEPLHDMKSSVMTTGRHHRGRGRRLNRAMTGRMSDGGKVNGSKGKKKKKKRSYPPYVLERSDVFCRGDELLVTIRIIDVPSEEGQEEGSNVPKDGKKRETERTSALLHFLDHLAQSLRRDDAILRHAASSVLQHRLRSLLPTHDAVAFVADGSVLPRRSGASSLPMSCPPAVPFRAPEGSPMRKTVTVEMGKLSKYLPEEEGESGGGRVNGSSTVSITGLVIPKGVTLIAGGGYHGKSTLLRTIAAGVYDKLPGDGRERCVTDRNAVTVRAEDGRYVNRCNVSAFISNLPTPPAPPPTASSHPTYSSAAASAIDTTQFSTREASGSTSQASNTSEAIEMGASAMLVDEDVSAANFMARDGRMRALVMDESITPFLYRVNGIYATLGISSVVVVGGVGDWLDVPHHVIKLDRYVTYDATEKARSISKQFSHGHVQYGGRGVVHRLPWEGGDINPMQRRPTDGSVETFRDAEVSLLEGGGRAALHGNGGGEGKDSANDRDAGDDDDDDDLGVIDMSRCEQLLGRAEQLYGCALCASWLIGEAGRNPGLGTRGLLLRLDEALDDGGLAELLKSPQSSSHEGNGTVTLKKDNDGSDLLSGLDTRSSDSLLESLGYAYRPRKLEVYMALTRTRGVQFENIPEDDDGAASAAERAAAERKAKLAELWANRRKGRNEK